MERRPNQIVCLDRSGLSWIFSLELSRHLGVKDGTACLLYNRILQAMSEGEESAFCRGTDPAW